MSSKTLYPDLEQYTSFICIYAALKTNQSDTMTEVPYIFLNNISNGHQRATPLVQLHRSL